MGGALALVRAAREHDYDERNAVRKELRMFAVQHGYREIKEHLGRSPEKFPEKAVECDRIHKFVHTYFSKYGLQGAVHKLQETFCDEEFVLNQFTTAVLRCTINYGVEEAAVAAEALSVKEVLGIPHSYKPSFYEKPRFCEPGSRVRSAQHTVLNHLGNIACDGPSFEKGTDLTAIDTSKIGTVRRHALRVLHDDILQVENDYTNIAVEVMMQYVVDCLDRPEALKWTLGVLRSPEVIGFGKQYQSCGSHIERLILDDIGSDVLGRVRWFAKEHFWGQLPEHLR